MSLSRHIAVDNAAITVLPLELVDALDQAYFLHLLVTDPQKVVPPGKSLLSMMTDFKMSDGSQVEEKREQIINRVKEVAHRAFWDEAAECLSSPTPSVQIPRLKLLYNDMFELVNALLPPKHPVLVSLSSPLPPTSSPLHSTINLLQELLTALRERCAPVRDQTIDQLLVSLDHPPDPKIQSISANSDVKSTPLAQFVVEKVKATLAVAEDMKSDLNTFVLGSMTENQLHSVLLNDVKVRERSLVLSIWGDANTIRVQWRSWVSEAQCRNPDLPNEKKWIVRLFQALESDQPIYCKLARRPPDTSSPQTNGTSHSDDIDHTTAIQSTPSFNALAPQLLFSTPTLLYIQNHIQAIVIAASLRSLTRLPPNFKTVDGMRSVESDFMTRIWTLLVAEIDDDFNARRDQEDSDGHATGQTKLANLADEVIRARQKSLFDGNSLSPEEEKTLRAAVERTLRTTDPVFMLLKKRLISALEKRLLLPVVESSESSTANNMIPLKMRTGKERSGKRARLMLPDSIVLGGISKDHLSNTVGIKLENAIPGFEDAVLQEAVSQVLEKIAQCLTWVEGIWGDLV